ncbi:MAG: hypothetical protein BWY09_01228 [Candidatus Hydrogenedentes bacterium ADurb.Bin179]|nr:MAG: hypothetical protein BWY09_01228 [Candidatus Hydrogenedentes bacterium ADurb.Bin179]
MPTVGVTSVRANPARSFGALTAVGTAASGVSAPAVISNTDKAKRRATQSAFLFLNNNVCDIIAFLPCFESKTGTVRHDVLRPS